MLGKFVNVAAFTRLNPGEHPYHRASLHHFMYRSSYYWPDEPDEAGRLRLAQVAPGARRP